MGYRDALIGGGLLVAGVRDSRTEGGWFLASAGADASDPIGGLAVRHELSERDHLIGLGGAAVRIVVGVAGYIRASRRPAPAER